MTYGHYVTVYPAWGETYFAPHRAWYGNAALVFAVLHDCETRGRKWTCEKAADAEAARLYRDVARASEA